MSNKLIYAVFLIILLAASFYSGYWLGGHNKYNTVKTDTVKVLIPVDVIKSAEIKHAKAKHTPFYTTKTDTSKSKDSVLVDVASIDTVITDSVSTINIKVKYYSRPLDYFDVSTSIKYRFYKERIFINNYIVPDEKWYSRFHIGAGIGLSVISEMKVYTSINVGFYYDIW